MAITDYGYKRKITIDHTVVDSTETDYPAMVKLYEDSSVSAWSSSTTYAVDDIVTNDGAYFKCTTASTSKEPRVTTDWQDDWHYLGEEFDFSNVETTGYDFRFYASNETTELDYERELFDYSTEPYQAVFHIRIPSVSSSVDTDYYMYYGYADATDGENATGVWDSNFVLINHMGDSLADSTFNGNDGTNYGTTVVDGLNGKSRSFGNGDYVEISHSTSLNLDGYTDDITIDILTKRTSLSEKFTLLAKYNASSTSTDRPFYMESENSSPDNIKGRVYDGSNTPKVDGGDISDNIYRFLSYNIDNSTDKLKIYNNLNYSETTNTITQSVANTSELFIGNYYAALFNYNGTIDEVRISNTARSDSWIKMDDANLRTWSLQSVGVEESTAATNTTEPLAKTLIDENLVNATDNDRNISILSIIENQGRGTVQEVETSNERLDKILEKILAVDDYGHKIYIDDGLKYDVIVPETKSVQFSNKIYNLLEARQQLSESNYKTFVYIDGDTTSDAYGTSTGFDRKELYLSTTTDTGLQDKAKQELDGKYYQTNAIQGKIRIVGNPFEYKTDYDLGDIVTVIFNNTVYTVQITEITETYTPNGFELDLTFGTPRRDFSTLIQDIKEAK